MSPLTHISQLNSRQPSALFRLLYYKQVSFFTDYLVPCFLTFVPLIGDPAFLKCPQV